MIAGIVQTNSGAVDLYAGSSGSAAAPAGDTSRYLGIGDGGAARFDMRVFFNSQSQRARSSSVHVGSVDACNFIDVLDGNLAVLKAIGGSREVFVPSGLAMRRRRTRTIAA